MSRVLSRLSVAGGMSTPPISATDQGAIAGRMWPIGKTTGPVSASAAAGASWVASSCTTAASYSMLSLGSGFTCVGSATISREGSSGERLPKS